MSAENLLSMDLGGSATVFTENFALNAKVQITLEGGVVNHWLYATDGTMLAINPDGDEMFLFKPTDTEIEKDDGVVVESGKDYEFSYQDRGAIETSEGEALYDESEELEFSDYEAGDGTRIRITTNTFNGEELAYIGSIVTEDDIIINE